MAKNILILHGSPRHGGNSATLAEMLQAGAEAAGHRVTSLAVGNMNISGCTACEFCKDHDKKCLLDDDMEAIYPHLLASDIIVFAAPLYYYTFPTQLKAVVDRFYAIDDGTFKKECVLLMTAMDDQKAFAGAEKTYELAMLDYLGWTDRGRIFVGNVADIGDIKDNPALADAYQLGFKL